MEEIILDKNVKLEKSTFDTNGGMFDFDVPKDCDLIVLMGNKGGGYVPFRCLLPHQVYMTDIEEVFAETQFEVIYVVPISSKSPFQIAYKNDYSKKRWSQK